MKQYEFNKLIKEESILSSMRGISEISIPTLVNKFERENNKYWDCKFELDTSSIHVLKDRTELLSSMYLMTTVGSIIPDLFNSNDLTFDSKFIQLTVDSLPIAIELTRNVLSLYESFKLDMVTFFNNIGKVTFNWYRVDTTLIEIIDNDEILEEADYTFTVNDFVENSVELMEQKAKDIVELLRAQTNKISSKDGLSQSDWDLLFEECNSMELELYNIARENMELLKEKCDEYVKEKKKKLRTNITDVQTDLVLTVDICEMQTCMNIEIEKYIERLRDNILATLKLRKNNMELLKVHMKY